MSSAQFIMAPPAPAFTDETIKTICTFLVCIRRSMFKKQNHLLDKAIKKLSQLCRREGFISCDIFNLIIRIETLIASVNRDWANNQSSCLTLGRLYISKEKDFITALYIILSAILSDGYLKKSSEEPDADPDFVNDIRVAENFMATADVDIRIQRIERLN